MKLSGEEYEAIVEASPNMIWRAGLDANCDYFNATWLRFTGRTIEEEIGSGWLSGVHPDDMDTCMSTYLEAFKKRELFEMVYRLKRYDGQWRWINDRGVPAFNSSKTFVGYIGSCMDVTEKVEGQKLTEMAHYDKLTGIYNRNYLELLIDYETQKSLRDHYPIVYMMIDIDNFKCFNDRYGHDFGDKVLANVASAISKKLRDTDHFGRYGGDEYLIILPRNSISDARVIAQRILDGVAQLKIENSYEQIGLSIGIAEQKDDVSSSISLKSADEAMYRAKKNGGNQISF